MALLPWLPPLCIGRYTLGFPWVWNKCATSYMTPTNLPLVQAWWIKNSVFHLYDHLAASYFLILPSAELEDVIAHIKVLIKFTQQALNSDQAISLLNSEVTLTIKVVLQDHTALNILLASQWDTCTIIQTECCVFISDESSNIKHFMTHMKNQISALSDVLPNIGHLLKNLFNSGSSWLKSLLKTLLMLLAVLLIILSIL